MSTLDVRMLKESRQEADQAQLLATTRMREVAAETFDNQLLTDAVLMAGQFRHVSGPPTLPNGGGGGGTALEPRTPKHPKAPSPSPAGGTPKIGGEGGGGGPEKRKPKERDPGTQDEKLSTNAKWSEISRVVKDTRQCPDPEKDGGPKGWRQYKERLAAEYTTITGKPYEEGVAY